MKLFSQIIQHIKHMLNHRILLNSENNNIQQIKCEILLIEILFKNNKNLIKLTIFYLLFTS